MRKATLTAAAILTLTGGCALVGRAPPENAPVATASAGVATPSAAAAVRPETPTAGVRAAHAANAPKTVVATAKPAAKAPGAQAPTPLPAKKESAAAPAKTESAPPLDLAALEQRLKETKAIGLMTKLTIKNQVDDLLNRFRDFYHGRLRTTLAELRQPFELLILKVLSLLQDTDPSLANAIAASREALWRVLSDPSKFAMLEGETR